MRHKLIVGGVSSTELKKRVKNLKKQNILEETVATSYLNISGLTTKGVIEYIVNNGIYSK